MSPPVSTRWIDISPGFAGYLALPPAGRGPGLVLFQEIFGVNQHIRAVAEQYALDGFVVLAPDVFWRQAPRVDLGYEGEDRQRALTLMQGYGGADALADMRVAVATLRARPEVTASKVGAFGYCMGGRLAYLAAATAGVDAAVAFYGGGIHAQLEHAAAVACPIQFHFAERDDHIPPAAVDSVRQAFAGKAAEVHVYPGAMHGFNCWARASYHAGAAALAHGRTLSFLAATLL
jgi:carboxymethylenebutenolidase